MAGLDAESLDLTTRIQARRRELQRSGQLPATPTTASGRGGFDLASVPTGDERPELRSPAEQAILNAVGTAEHLVDVDPADETAAPAVVPASPEAIAEALRVQTDAPVVVPSPPTPEEPKPRRPRTKGATAAQAEALAEGVAGLTQWLGRALAGLDQDIQLARSEASAVERVITERLDEFGRGLLALAEAFADLRRTPDATTAGQTDPGPPAPPAPLIDLEALAARATEQPMQSSELRYKLVWKAKWWQSRPRSRVVYRSMTDDEAAVTKLDGEDWKLVGGAEWWNEVGAR